ncbi:MAG: 5'-methylthioadenosine/adenosylhomocysteine nucleosidase [Oscillospiraceae bacterium]|nr:5'-methylthioadenosine/adenosylhomocysteine nucleosidase [Oscillospiraceae bacterium]
MNKLGIIGAMRIEVETLVEKMENVTKTNRAWSDYYEGTLEGMDVVVVQCGVGKVNAALCTQILCSCYGVSHIVNTGIAGSLCAQLDIGDLVVSKDAMYHDFDCNAFGYPSGWVPGMDVTAFPAEETMIRYAMAAAESVHPGHVKLGRIASGDQFVAEKALKEKIIATTQGLCTEMEGAAIAQTAYRNGIPFVILRAISDKADDSAEMDYPTFERIAAHRCAEVTCRLAQQLKASEEV